MPPCGERSDRCSCGLDRDRTGSTRDGIVVSEKVEICERDGIDLRGLQGQVPRHIKGSAAANIATRSGQRGPTDPLQGNVADVDKGCCNIKHAIPSRWRNKGLRRGPRGAVKRTERLKCLAWVERLAEGLTDRHVGSAQAEKAIGLDHTAPRQPQIAARVNRGRNGESQIASEGNRTAPIVVKIREVEIVESSPIEFVHGKKTNTPLASTRTNKGHHGILWLWSGQQLAQAITLARRAGRLHHAARWLHDHVDVSPRAGFPRQVIISGGNRERSTQSPVTPGRPTQRGIREEQLRSAEGNAPAIRSKFDADRSAAPRGGGQAGVRWNGSIRRAQTARVKIQRGACARDVHESAFFGQNISRNVDGSTRIKNS